MAKINKKNAKKSDKKFKLTKTKETKHCFVNLFKISQKERDFYRNSSQVTTKTFDLHISDSTLSIGDKKQHSTNNTFNIKLKKTLSELTIEHCEQIHAPARSQSFLPVVRKTSNPPTLNSLITSAWNKCKSEFKSSGKSIETDMIVMSKMSTYSPWPSRLVDCVNSKKKTTVYFFGDHTTGAVNTTEIVPFADCFEVIKLLLLRKISVFHKSVMEVERLLGIGPEQSMLKEKRALQ